MKKIGLFLLLCLSLAASPLWAQNNQSPAKDKALAELQKNMAGEGALTETDIKTYINNLESILSLYQDPVKLSEAVKKLGWTEKRYAYVTTKMSVGLAELAKPDDPNLKNVPDFARPTAKELELIKASQPELMKVVESLQKKGVVK